MALDPHIISTLPHINLAHIHTVLSYLPAPPIHDLHSIQELISQAATIATDAASTATDAAAAATEAAKPGAWAQFVHLVETAIVALHGKLVSAGIPGAYGLSIIIFTVIVKALTFPLNFKQMKSTLKLQALTPRLKKIQTDYKDNPQVLNQMTAQLYKDEEINPLAGCLPVFAQIPVWIALYRSVLNLASANLLNESFLWLPSLQGPVSKTGQGLDTWLFPLIDGAPPIGWHDAICYLILPVLLTITQFYSQKLIQPANQDPQQAQANTFLKFMPLLIGWFALNVPSGLGVYWVTNNLLSTAQTVYIRQKFPDLTKPKTDPAQPVDVSSKGVFETSSLEEADGFRSNGTSPSEGGSTKSLGSGGKKTKSKKRRKRR